LCSKVLKWCIPLSIAVIVITEKLLGDVIARFKQNFENSDIFPYGLPCVPWVGAIGLCWYIFLDFSLNSFIQNR